MLLPFVGGVAPGLDGIGGDVAVAGVAGVAHPEAAAANKVRAGIASGRI